MTAKIGPALNLLAIAATAFCLADFAHEGLGHGGACLASGGRILALSTTYEDCSVRSRAIDGAGPAMGLMVALLAWVWLRFAPPRSQNMRAFFCLLFAFTIFWNVGYMIYSGLLDRGDWKFVVAGLQPAVAWRVALVVGGVILYSKATRVLHGLMSRNLASDDGWRPESFALVALVGACVLATVGAAFDPRGSAIILSDALPSALSSLGLVWASLTTHRRLPTLRIAVTTSPAWVAIGLLSAIAFVAVLGPGLRF